MQPARGNVPLAAGYLKMYAQSAGLDAAFDIDIFPAPLANTLSDQGLVEALLERDPWMVGFTCYLWNVDRTLWVAAQLKARRPELLIIVGGPEITADNAWVLDRPELDFAAIGEGEQTFTELLTELTHNALPTKSIDGLWVSPRTRQRAQSRTIETGSGFSLPIFPAAALSPAFRKPLPSLDPISSPYLCGILDAADEQMLLLETIRGCIFKCKFCYYPKSYDALYFVSQEKIEANLKHARDRGAREVTLLDPTLNQRKDFPDFLKLLGRCNPDHQFTYFGELRAEGIDRKVAQLLKDANFTEVEIGLQSVDPLAMELMDRKNNFKAFERGVRAMLDVGLNVKIDLIIGLPGDTADSIRRGFEYVHESGLYSDVQVFNLSILPGTAFRQEAAELGLRFQPRPPYYVLETPTLQLDNFYSLMSEAEDIFDIEFDAHGTPELPATGPSANGLFRTHRVDLDEPESAREPLPPASERSQAFTLRLRGSTFKPHRKMAAELVTKLLADNPHSTLQIVVEPTGDPREITPGFLESLRVACFAETSYLDRFYAILPGRWAGAKRLIVRLPIAVREELGLEWIEQMAEFASIAWQGEGSDMSEDDLEPHEFLMTV